MADLHTITVDLNEIRTRAESIAQIRIKRNTTPDEELRTTMSTMGWAIEECRLAEQALKVEQLKNEQEMLEAGYAEGEGGNNSAAFARQMVVFQEYIDTFTRRIAAIERELDSRSDKQS